MMTSDDLKQRIEAIVKRKPAAVQAPLGPTADLAGARVLGALSTGEAHADRGAVAVVLGGLDHEPAREPRARLGDRPAAGALPGGVLGGDDPQVGGELGGMGEALEVADLGAEPERAQGVDPAQAAKPGDPLGPGALRPALGDRLVER